MYWKAPPPVGRPPGRRYAVAAPRAFARRRTSTALVRDDGVIRGPAPPGRVAIVTRADIARIRCEAGDRSVDFHDETVPEAYASRRRWGAPSWQNDAWVSTCTAIASGELSTVSTDVHRVTGRQPMSLQEFLRAPAPG